VVSQVELVQGEGATPVGLHEYLAEAAEWSKADALLLLAMLTAMITLATVIVVVTCYRARR
jgi:hypothetical protein